MKTLITLLLLIAGLEIFAKDAVSNILLFNKDKPTTILELLAQDRDPQTQAYLKRLKEFELDQVQMKSERNLEEKVSADEILRKLDRDLIGPYLKNATSALGDCSRENCLSRENGTLKLEDSIGGKHCYPGTNCDYYKCMEEKYRCNEVGFNYFSELAQPTCSSYVDRIGKNKFSEDGVEWIYTVMVCLQKGLFEECSLRGHCDQASRAKVCEHIVDFTLEFHPGCYIESGIGVCKLPFKDQLSIWKTVGPYLTDRERVEAFKVVYHCFFK